MHVPRCPRCRHSIPRDECPGEYPGARSRITVDNVRVIEICSICGEDEAYEVLTKGEYTPVSEWPIEDWLDITKSMEKTMEEHKQFLIQRHKEGRGWPELPELR